MIYDNYLASCTSFTSNLYFCLYSISAWSVTHSFRSCFASGRNYNLEYDQSDDGRVRCLPFEPFVQTSPQEEQLSVQAWK